MMSSPNASAKWSKYGVEDGKLVRKAEFCPRCGPEYSLRFTLTAKHVVAVDTPLRMSDHSDLLMWRLKLP